MEEGAGPGYRLEELVFTVLGFLPSWPTRLLYPPTKNRSAPYSSAPRDSGWKSEGGVPLLEKTKKVYLRGLQIHLTSGAFSPQHMLGYRGWGTGVLVIGLRYLMELGA